MSSPMTHLFDLPPELIFLIFKAMDFLSLQNIESTCTYFKQMVENFRDTHKDIWESKLRAMRAGVDDGSDDDGDLYDYSDDPCSNDVDYYFDGMLDNLSFGSNYDEEIDDYMTNG